MKILTPSSIANISLSILSESKFVYSLRTNCKTNTQRTGTFLLSNFHNNIKEALNKPYNTTKWDLHIGDM